MEISMNKTAKKLGIQVAKVFGYVLIAYVVTWGGLGIVAPTLGIHDFDQLGIINYLYLQNVVVIVLGCVILEKLHLLRKELKDFKEEKATKDGKGENDN